MRFGFFIYPLTGYEPKLAMSMSTLRRRRSEASKREEEGTLEIGVADRRLDAFIEEEVRRTRSADAGPRRSTAEASTPQGRPKALRPSPSQEPRDRTAAAGGEPTDPSSLKSMKPVDPARSLSVDPGHDLPHGGLGALHDAVQQTYHVLRQALGQHLQGQGLLGPLGPPIDQPAHGGLFGDGRMPVDPRTLEYGSGGAQTPVRPQEPNPFWSPALQDTMRRASSGLSGDLSGGADSRRLHVPGGEPVPRVIAEGNAMPAAASGSPVRDDVEALRTRILKEAEENFDREVKRLLAAKEPADTTSYKTASSGPQTGVDSETYAGPERPPGLHHGDLGGKDRGPDLSSKVVRVGGAATPAAMAEALRNLELPPLPSPNSEGASILFGDWLTMSFLLMADISNSAKAWWEESLTIAQDHYARWLTMSPLERLRAKPVVVVEPALQRIEQRGIAMLSGALPDQLRRDLVSGRQLSVVYILYKLHVTYQPGGGAEKTQLLKNLVETKFATQTSELLTQVRLWRRWLARAQELNLALPDPVVLMVTVQRMIESATKSGGAQMAFRIANVRQELRVDYAATVEAVMELSEYVQAEVEEVSLTTPMKLQPATTNAGAAGTQPTTSVKAMASAFGAVDSDDRPSQKSACKFWKSDEGCKRGSSCTYAHDNVDMKGRCFNCGGLHMKKDCPNGPKGVKPDAKKVSKVKTVKEGEKMNGGEKNVKGGSPGDEPADENVNVPLTAVPKRLDSPEKPVAKDATAELLSEATSLLKTLRSMKMLRVKELKHKVGTDEEAVGLLDGGATNGLREAYPHEMPHLVPVRVELASGSATLYKVNEHRTLLSKEKVEVIVPLHRLVGLGYRLNWSKGGVKISHPEYGRIECTLRGGCPVLPERQALALLEVMEKADRGELMIDEEIKSWWTERFPEVPEETWNYMKGQTSFDPQVCPWNRHQRRRHERSKGIILHLYSGKDSQSWLNMDWHGYEVINVDIVNGAQYDMHSIGTWSYLCHLARRGKVVAVLGGPPCRSVSRLRHRGPGPRPVRGRDERRFGLPGLSSVERDLVVGVETSRTLDHG